MREYTHIWILTFDSEPGGKDDWRKQ
jgi:hypothetical protein